MQSDYVTRVVRCWVEDLVVGLNLCPFAGRELIRERVRFAVTDAATEAGLLMDLRAELELLDSNAEIETTLLVHPGVLQDFYVYNQFLDEADRLLLEMHRDGVYQVASFHPDYRFGGTDPEDAENYTNRSPYPLLHLIREESLERAIATCPDPQEIPERNIALMKSLGKDRIQGLLQACFDKNETS